MIQTERRELSTAIQAVGWVIDVAVSSIHVVMVHRLYQFDMWSQLRPVDLKLVGCQFSTREFYKCDLSNEAIILGTIRLCSEKIKKST